MSIQEYITTELSNNTKSKECLNQYLNIVNEAFLAKRRRYSKDDSRYVYYEQHHILPKSLYPDYAKDKANLVLLTAEEHFECHKLLIEIFPGQAMAHAFWRMCCCNGNKSIITKEDYSYARMMAMAYPPAKGLKHSNETKKILSEKSKKFWCGGGYTHTKEQDIKMVETRRNKGSFNRSKDLNKKVSEKLKGRIFVNNGESNKFIYPDELENYLALGWAKGKKPLSEEHKRKIGESGKGRSGWNKGMPGTFLGKKHSDESKKKMSETKRRKKELANAG